MAFTTPDRQIPFSHLVDQNQPNQTWLSSDFLITLSLNSLPQILTFGCPEEEVF